jgi:integrase
MFRWAHRVARLVQTEPWYGDRFSKTSAAEKRRARTVDRVFTHDELRKILLGAKGPLRTFTLLALNCGMYAADIAQIHKVDLKRVGTLWLIDNDREKTSIRRRVPLWPETVKAIEATRDKSDRPLLFYTAFGKPWVRDGINSIVMRYTDFLTGLGIKRAGLNFGAFKHTHVSAVGDSGDLTAARLVRGHKVSGIESHYDFPNLKRLKAITDLARTRLLTSVVRERSKPPGSPARRRVRPSPKAAARSA